MATKSKQKNNIMAITGLILTGAGLSMAIDAGINKSQNKSWFLYGSVALIVFNAGICLVADAAVNK